MNLKHFQHNQSTKMSGVGQPESHGGKSNESNGHSLRASETVCLFVFSLWWEAKETFSCLDYMHARVLLHIHESSPMEIIIFPAGSPLPANLQHWISVRAAEEKGCELSPLLALLGINRRACRVWWTGQKRRKRKSPVYLYSSKSGGAEACEQGGWGTDAVLRNLARKQTCSSIQTHTSPFPRQSWLLTWRLFHCS